MRALSQMLAMSRHREGATVSQLEASSQVGIQESALELLNSKKERCN
jgi:hypothetical protein